MNILLSSVIAYVYIYLYIFSCVILSVRSPACLSVSVYLSVWALSQLKHNKIHWQICSREYFHRLPLLTKSSAKYNYCSCWAFTMNNCITLLKEINFKFLYNNFSPPFCIRSLCVGVREPGQHEQTGWSFHLRRSFTSVHILT